MTREIPLTRGFVAVVDDEDYERAAAAGRWYPTPPRGLRVYAQMGVRKADGRRTTQKLHTFLTGWPEVDHIDGDGLNNTRTNLRPATRSQNNGNARRRLNISGYKGVSWQKRDRIWYARIQLHGQKRYLGGFKTAEDAARAYDAAALEVFGAFARTNFPISREASS